jgi:hypothetical protein
MKYILLANLEHKITEQVNLVNYLGNTFYEKELDTDKN